MSDIKNYKGRGGFMEICVGNVSALSGLGKWSCYFREGWTIIIPTVCIKCCRCGIAAFSITKTWRCEMTEGPGDFKGAC